MITGEAEFEAALQEADGLLHTPPGEGTPEHARLMELLKDLASWRPNLGYPAEPAIAAVDWLTIEPATSVAVWSTPLADSALGLNGLIGAFFADADTENGV